MSAFGRWRRQGDDIFRVESVGAYLFTCRVNIKAPPFRWSVEQTVNGVKHERAWGICVKGATVDDAKTCALRTAADLGSNASRRQ